MQYVIELGDTPGRSVTLTTEHSASSYGIPVLHVVTPTDNLAMGPGDSIDGEITAGDLVKAWLAWERTSDERKAGEAFLASV